MLGDTERCLELYTTARDVCSRCLGASHPATAEVRLCGLMATLTRTVCYTRIVTIALIHTNTYTHTHTHTHSKIILLTLHHSSATCQGHQFNFTFHFQLYL
jgi:hypothetical protein